ncbi:MAG: hypothetical protein GVY11_01410 [Gammaproteobacteria bacterium]|jgi:hypothetical protein|nr:hypothetical protein [Gammaproteobacteria bacterium]
MSKRDLIENLHRSARPEAYTLLFSVLSTAPGAIVLSESVIVVFTGMIIYACALFIFRGSIGVLRKGAGIFLAVITHAVFTLGLGVFLWGVQGQRAGPGFAWLLFTVALYFLYVTPQLRRQIANIE